jgi:predicted amidohydrolase
MIALALLALAAAPAQARTTRVFAMQPKLDVAWMQSRATYRAKMFALADRRLRGPGTPAIQRGAGDFASHLTGRDLVVWPEDVGLFAALSGQRAAPARSSGSLEGAVAALIGAYGPQNAYYAQRFPDAAARTPPVRLTEGALTDTFARVTVETFAAMAQRYHVWLEAGATMAQRWHVVCNDRAAFNAAKPARLPGGVKCDEQNPAKVQALRDPFEPARDYAYEATTDRVSNMALLFDPRGRLVSKQVKTYLTPIELPGQLDLVPGRVTGGLSAAHTPVGTLGFVTSKDAWMPDVQAKLDEAHVDLLVQPEFFVGDLVTSKGMWAPDGLKASAYSNAQRMPSLSAVALPELVGNIFDFSADAQSHFALAPGRRPARAGHLVGQPDAPGLINSPWVVRDPIRRGEPFAARRARLAKAGAALAPGSGVACPDPRRAGPCENGHVEGVFRRDVRVALHPRYRRFRGRARHAHFTRARPIAPSHHAQRQAAIALRGRFGVAAYEERRGGHDAVFVVTTRDGGRSWSRPRHPTGRRAGRVDEQLPAVALGARRRITLAWVDHAGGTPRVRAVYSRGGRRFSRPRAIEPVAAAQWKPALAPGGGGVALAAWIDERERSSDDDLPQAHVRFTVLNRGRRVAASRRLDTAAPAALAAKLDHAWAPRVAVRGRRVTVAWTDFHDYDWGVFVAVSGDGGTSFRRPMRVTDNREGQNQQEELADSPDVTLLRRSPLVTWTDWRKRDSSARKPHEEYDVFAAVPGRPNRQLDPYGTRQVSTFAPTLCRAARDRVLVAFQDAASGPNRVRITTASRHRRALLFSATPRRAGSQWRPRLACSGGRVLATWEDQRDGPAQVYYATGRSASLARAANERRRTSSK